MQQGWTCGRCGTANPAGQKFCGNCGFQAPAQGPPASGPPAAGPPPQGPPPAGPPPAGAPPQGAPPAGPAGYGPPGYPGGPGRGFPTWGWFAIGGGVLAIIAVVLVVVLTGGEDPPTQIAQPAPGPQDVAPTVNPAYEELVAQLPAEFGACQPVAPGGVYAQARAAAYCTPTGRTDVDAFFWIFASPEEAGITYSSVTQSVGQTPDSGACDAEEGGEHSWSGAGGSGRISCGRSEELASVLWSADGFAIIGQMTARTSATTPPDLYAFWQGIPNYVAV